MTSRLDWLLRSDTLPSLFSDTGLSEAEFAEQLRALQHYEFSFAQLLKLDRGLQGPGQAERLTGLLTPLRVAVLGSSTLDHLLPALRVVGLRHGFLLTTYTTDYGQYLAEIMDAGSGLYAFAPEVVLFALDADHLIGNGVSDRPEAAVDATIDRLRDAWRILSERLGAQIIQQTALPRLPLLMGSNEHRLPGAPARMLALFNACLREEAADANVDLLALDMAVVQDGLRNWHDPVLWLKAKQEISPLAAQHYAELALRLVSARRGRSAKCLVLDLDNTLWGGVIGDDGLEGIVLGQGSPEGEAYLSLQRYAHALMKRGVILAICSKNDEAVALSPFERHAEMILRREHISCFVANWTDKAANLRRIADEIGIGLDALVLLDDNPFERNLVRQALPMVRVPELPEDPALYADTLARSGYFEAVTLTEEDRARTELYAAKTAREKARGEITDLDGYLATLDMVLEWKRVDALSLARVTQLANKTNQFNLTTRRYTEAEMAALAEDPRALVLHFRLRDAFGDNGIIAVVIGRLDPEGTLEIEAWLMSCRVLGRHVEKGCFAVLAEQARRLGTTSLRGSYLPTEKNAMVRDHYAKLGFVPLEEVATGDDQGATHWRFDLSDTIGDVPHIRIVAA